MPRSLVIAQPRAVLDDPHACTDSADVLTVFGALFDPLIRRDGQGGFLPALAESWSMSPDARALTLRLRQGVRFHNGDPVDAEAVRFCLLRMADPAQGGTLGAPGVYAQYLAGMTVDIPDPATIHLTLPTPLADIADILCYGHIVSPRALAAAGDDLAARMVGTGPYRLADWTPGQRIRAVANPGHFAGPPALPGIDWVAQPAAADRVAALHGGAADIANAIEQEPIPPGAVAFDYLAPTALVFLLNAAAGPCADPRVRRALNLAIDRDALVRDVLAGAGQPLTGFISPHHVGFDPAAPVLRQDLPAARRLLAEAGHDASLTLAIDCPTRLPDEAEALVAAVAAQLVHAGVTLEVTLHPDRVAYANRVRLKLIGDICVFDSSPMSTFRVLAEKIDSRFAGSWWQGYRNPAVETLLDRARATPDPETRAALHCDAYRRLQDDPPWLYLYNHTKRIARTVAVAPFAIPDDGVLDVRRLAFDA